MPPSAITGKVEGCIVDGVLFARERKSIVGSINSDRMPRISALLVTTTAFEYSVQGFVNALGYPSLRMRVHGRAMMACQRCLAPVEVAVGVNADLEMREALAEIEGANDDVDRVLAGKAMDVVALVEDEVLLELPMVARHAVCEPANEEAAGSRRPSPFAVLAKRQRH